MQILFGQLKPRSYIFSKIFECTTIGMRLTKTNSVSHFPFLYPSCTGDVICSQFSQQGTQFQDMVSSSYSTILIIENGDRLLITMFNFLVFFFFISESQWFVKVNCVNSYNPVRTVYKFFLCFY